MMCNLLVVATVCLLLSTHVDMARVVENPDSSENENILTPDVGQAYSKQLETSVSLRF